MRLPRASLTYGYGYCTWHPAGGKSSLQGGKGSNPRLHGPHSTLQLANGMRYLHTTWTTPLLNTRPAGCSCLELVSPVARARGTPRMVRRGMKREI